MTAHMTKLFMAIASESDVCARSSVVRVRPWELTITKRPFQTNRIYIEGLCMYERGRFPGIKDKSGRNCNAFFFNFEPFSLCKSTALEKYIKNSIVKFEI